MMRPKGSSVLLLLSAFLAVANASESELPVHVFAGHSGGVECLAFSADSSLLASGDEDGGVRVWNVVWRQELLFLSGNTSAVSSLAFSPDGLLASGSDDGTIKLWHLATGSEFRALAGNSPVYSVAFSPDGRLLASGTADHEVKVWNVSSGALVQALHGHTGEVTSVAFSPDGALLASGATDRSIRVWEVSPGAVTRVLHASSPVICVAFSPNGGLLTAGVRDGTATSWEVASGTAVGAVLGQASATRSFDFLAVSEYRSFIIRGEVGLALELWDIATRAPVPTCAGIPTVRSIALSPDGKFLATGTADREVDLWDVKSLFGGTVPTVATPSPSTSATTYPSARPALKVRWDGHWECSAGSETCIVDGWVTITNHGGATATGIVCWAGLRDGGDLYYDQDIYRDLELEPGESLPLWFFLHCPYGVWTRVDIRVQSHGGTEITVESEEFLTGG